MPLSDKTKEILRNAILMAMLLSIMTLIPLLVALGKGGLEQQLIFQQLAIYGYFGTACLIIILIFSAVRTQESTQDNNYGNSVAFADIGEFPSVKLPFIKNGLGLFFLSIGFFSILGFVKLLIAPNVAFTGVPFIQQQFTPFDSIILSNTLVPISENAGAGALLSIWLFSLGYFGRKYKLSRTNYLILAWAGAIILFIAYTFILHQLRYGNSDVILINSMMLWGLGGFLTILTGSFIPFWVAHTMSNLFLDLQEFYSNDFAYIISVVIGAISIYLYWFFTFRKSKVKEIV